MTVGLKDMMKSVHQTAVDKGWWEPQCRHENTLAGSRLWCRDCGALRLAGLWVPPNDALRRNTGEIMMLMVTEIAEAYEQVRLGEPEDFVYHTDGKPEGVPIEIADLVIRVADYCEAREIDLEQAVIEKSQYNRSRPYRHGGKVS